MAKVEGSPEPGRSATYHRVAMTAKEKLLERAPGFTEAEATAALRVVEAQAELARYFDEEAKLSRDAVHERENTWAEANAREAIREEPW
jgi:hypothetical protein